MEFEKVIKERHATRKFSNQAIKPELLEKILEAGRLAPTAKNLQPVKIYVLQSPEALTKIDNATPCRYNAPVVLLICGNTNEAWQKEDYSSYEMDSCIVTTHMMLEATNLGIQNIWVELFDKEIVKEEFSLPKELIPICLLPIGYESSDCPPSHFHDKRKDLSEIVEYY